MTLDEFEAAAEHLDKLIEALRACPSREAGKLAQVYCRGIVARGRGPNGNVASQFAYAAAAAEKVGKRGVDLELALADLHTAQSRIRIAIGINRHGRGDAE